MPNQQELKKRLYAFYDLNKEKGDRFISDRRVQPKNNQPVY